ncbi:G protein subunit gamma 4, partial [Chelydra serpentina]
ERSQPRHVPLPEPGCCCCCCCCGVPGQGVSRAAVSEPPRRCAGRENRMKEIMSNNNTTNISQARKAVEQLKMEAYMDRIKVSKAAADLLAYCDAHIGEDPLIIPVPASENPFREKKFFCTIL